MPEDRRRDRRDEVKRRFPRIMDPPPKTVPVDTGYYSRTSSGLSKGLSVVEF
jgi:hypothetical protein